MVKSSLLDSPTPFGRIQQERFLRHACMFWNVKYSTLSGDFLTSYTELRKSLL